MHRLPSRTASGGHCVPAPEAVDRIASQRAHAQANAHSAAGSAASYSRSARPADILACVGSRTHQRIPGARRAQNRRDHDLCMCLSNRKQHWPGIEQTRKFRILPRCPAEPAAGEAARERPPPHAGCTCSVCLEKHSIVVMPRSAPNPRLFLV